ncbi:MAG: superoxide dismutase [Patescibacteria group bacterium]|nr:superoxide dismutase [Patescibacteria group bacterium]MDD5490795.1 superoxide dismutase [Patescibacteria group bacterium]
MNNKFYSLPDLPYGYKDLEPYISEEQLTVHYQKHHAAYVKGANAALEKLDKARGSGAELDMKATSKDLSWNIGGHILHSLFWQNLSPVEKTTKEPEGKLAEVIKEEFGSFERFKDEFTKAAMSVEGSGWAALTFCRQTNRPLIMQIEKHNTNVYPGFKILLVLDMFEHAFYIDQKNEKGKYVEAFWSIINWRAVAQRIENLG